MPTRVLACASGRLSAAALCLLLAGCSAASSSPRAEGGASLPPPAPPGPGPSAGYAVPAVITAAYVQRVLDALDSVDGEAFRMVKATGSLPPGALERIRAITTPSFFAEQSSILMDQMRSGFSSLRPDPGAPHDEVQGIVSASHACIFASVSRDLSALVTSLPAQRREYLTLRPRQDPGALEGLDPTPWAIGFIGYESDGSAVPDRCAA